jgi:hypothetical protein
MALRALHKLAAVDVKRTAYLSLDQGRSDINNIRW